MPLVGQILCRAAVVWVEGPAGRTQRLSDHAVPWRRAQFQGTPGTTPKHSGFFFFWQIIHLIFGKGIILSVEFQNSNFP